MRKLLYIDEVYSNIGAAIEVHNVLGCGYPEPVYQEALKIEIRTRQIPDRTQKQHTIDYKGQILQKCYIADFISYDENIIEINALDHLSSVEEAQLLNYLKASRLEVGLLINFGAESLQWKRMILSKKEIYENSRISG